MILMEITPTDIRTYTCGSCHALAAALYQATGWPIATFGELPSYHWFVVMPDGRCLDIEGVKTQEEMCKRWSATEMGVHIFDKEGCERQIVEWRYMTGTSDFAHAKELIPTLRYLAETT